MRLLRDNVGSFKEDLQMETAAAKLAVLIVTANTIITEAVFNAMQIQVTGVSATGEKTILPKMALRDAFNMSALKEGFFVWGQKQLKGYLDLSRFGSLQIADGSYISISYEDFPADSTTNIYAIDLPVATNVAELVEEISINGTAKDLDVSHKSDLFIPVTDADGNGIDKVEVQFNGKTVTYLEEELKVLNDATNDITCVIDEQLDDADGTTRLIKFGYDRLLWLNVTGALSVKVTPKTRVPVVIYTARSVQF